MKNKTRKVSLALMLCSILFVVVACGTVNTTQSSPQCGTPQPTVAVQTIEDDAMDIGHEDNKTFYMVKTGDNLCEIYEEDGKVLTRELYVNSGVNVPDMKVGEILEVVADVQIYDGGEEGYCHNIFIDGIKSYTEVSHRDFLEVFDIPDASEHIVGADYHFLKYQDMDNLYLLIAEGSYLVAYKNGEIYGKYDMNSIYESEYPEQFFKMLEDDDETDTGTETDADSEVYAVPMDGYKQVSPEDAEKMMETETDYIIVDVRTEDEYDWGHTIDAIPVPLEWIAEYPDDETVYELQDKNQLIFVYCDTGRRSKAAANKLVKLGYTNVYEYYGYANWDRPLD